MTQIEQELSPADREQIYRHNFRYFLADGVLFSVAIGIIGTTTVIPDFVRRLTTSEILIGLSGNLFTIGYSFPQLIIAHYIVRHARKKWWFVGPNIPVRLILLIFAFITIWLGKDRPHLILLAFFVCYGIAAFGDGLVGVPWADLTGTSLDSRWRARLFGIMSAITGILMLLVTPLVGFVLGDNGPSFPNNYALLFGLSGGLFALSILPGMFIHELPGGKAVEKLPALSEFVPNLGRVLQADHQFRAFIIVRIFTSLFMMAGPFYIGYATVKLGLASEVAVPVLLAMQTIGSIVGALVYIKLGAHHNLLYVRLCLAGSALVPVCALLAGVTGPWMLYLGFLLSGLATSELLFGFQNWVVEYTHPNELPLYIGLSNTVAAIVSLIAPFIAGSIAQYSGYEMLFVVSFLMTLVAVWVALYSIHKPQNKLIEVMATGD
jgi:MFS family permease